MLNVGNPLAYGLDTVMDLQGRLRDVERVGPSTYRSLSSWHAQLLSRGFLSPGNEVLQKLLCAEL